MASPQGNHADSQTRNLCNLDEPLQKALGMLHRAYRYALDMGADVWDFAVEIDELRRSGLTNSEFRWLLASGYVQHAKETTPAGEEKRSFRTLGKHSFPQQACFVLTTEGEEFVNDGRQSGCSPCAKRHETADVSAPIQMEPSKNGERHPPPDEKPSWDTARKELRVGKQLIKCFKWPAVNQETILAVFEEEGWPARIDDPLPPVPEQEPKRRLHDTIKCLNRGQKVQLIRFRGDGTGEGVVWTYVTEQDSEEEN